MHFITENEDALFAEWVRERGYGDFFVKDGAPCPEKFEKAKYKITFVLKEAVAENEKYFDLREWVDAKGGRSQTWDNVTRWTQAILEGGDYSRKISEDDRKKWLRQISFMNSKKLGGTSTSKSAEIKQYAKKDGDFLLRQLKIYEPDIILCCGKLGDKTIGDCLHNWVMGYTEDNWNHSCDDAYKGCCFFYAKVFGKTTAVLDCYHPSNFSRHFDDEAMFTAIKSVALKILPVPHE